MKIKYRPEIDGLRAIAVCAVIIYHAKISVLGLSATGGFIGVDIFLVISGYLITSIIFKEFLTTGSFSFKYFYERRIRRILPTLLIVMLVSLPFAWKYLLQSNLVDFSKSILFSLGFSSNFYFHYSGQKYGAESGLFIPYLHTWTLSIEEQYYLLFPIIILIVFKYFREYLIYTLFIGFIISLSLANWSSKNYPSVSFYFLHTRIWEFLAGSIMAYFEIIRGYRSRNKTLNLLLPSLGLFLIGYSILFFNHETLHPSFYTLIPVIGVCLIIWFSHKGEITTKILSTKLFVSIGLISYALYLWHYPIFAFARITNIFNDNIIKEIFSAFIILFLSILSYHFIEKPFRNNKYQFKKLLIALTCVTIFLISFLFTIIKENGFEKRFPKIFQVKHKADNIDLYQKYNNKKIILIGDSHAYALIHNLNEEAKKNNLSLFEFGTELYLNNFNHTDKKKNETFKKNNDYIESFLKKNTNSIIILHQRWSPQMRRVYLRHKDLNTELAVKQREENIKSGITSQIQNIINHGHKLILVYPVPEMEFNPKRLLYNKHLFEENFFDNPIPILSTSYNKFKKQNKLIFEILDGIQSPYIYRVYPHEFFCNKLLKNRCIANDKENIFYYDKDHLSIQGSKFVVNKIMDIIKK